MCLSAFCGQARHTPPIQFTCLIVTNLEGMGGLGGRRRRRGREERVVERGKGRGEGRSTREGSEKRVSGFLKMRGIGKPKCWGRSGERVEF